MATRIEQLIDELDDLIDNSKYQPLSNTKIVVVKDEVLTLINELRKKVPEELAKSQKIVSNRQAIIKEAEERAEDLLKNAAAQTSEMISQNAIMQQAYQQADEIVKMAYQQAQEILFSATTDANNYKINAVEYLDTRLAEYEAMMTNTLAVTQQSYENFYSTISAYREELIANRQQLYPSELENTEDTGSINLENAEGIDNTGSLVNTASLANTGALSNTGSLSQGTGSIKIPQGVTGKIPDVNQQNNDSDTGDIKLM